MGFSNHAKQSFVSRLAINDPLRIKNLVATMLAVRLGKHHQFDIGGIATKLGKRLRQVIDLVLR